MSENFGRYLTQWEADVLQKLGDECMGAYCMLSQDAISSGKLLWPSRPKFHVSWIHMIVTYQNLKLKKCRVDIERVRVGHVGPFPYHSYIYTYLYIYMFLGSSPRLGRRSIYCNVKFVPRQFVFFLFPCIRGMLDLTCMIYLFKHLGRYF